MKIILAEERTGVGKLPEKIFDCETIRIGRSAAECQIVFERSEFPMVSRRHAELRCERGEWILQDLNSSYGTFVDNRKILAPVKINAGQTIQLGVKGPVLRVVWIKPENLSGQKESENSFAPSREFRQSAPKAPEIPFNPTNAFQKPDSIRLQQSQTAQLEFVGANSNLPPFKITKNTVWLGRDASADLVFESTAAVVSRRHAQIERKNGDFVLTDNNSFNGTLVNERRITTPTPIYHEDKIQLGLGGPVLRFNAPFLVAPKSENLAPMHSAAEIQKPNAPNCSDEISSKTIAANFSDFANKIPERQSIEPQLLKTLTFTGKNELFIGRGDGNDIKLDGLQISNRHARLVSTDAGVFIEDLNSTNGVYLNGNRVSRQLLSASDAAQIGAFVVRVDAARNVGVFDTRSKMRLDAVGITKEARSGAKVFRLLDDVSLSVRPNEFVGFIGQSGAGKSTLLNAVSGANPASKGTVLINNQDLYAHHDSLKQSIGYVPQEDTLHRELTVYRTLFYAAKLRLSSDVSTAEINQIVTEVLDVAGIAGQRNVLVNQLSGGQRKRLSVAVELVTKPSLIFLDEPTSGLDPATEEKIMRLFRQIAESGRTVVMTTHAMENVRLFDKIAILIRGKLCFYGKPDAAPEFFGATNFKELFDKIEELSEDDAESRKQIFKNSSEYKQNVDEPINELGKIQAAPIAKKRRLGVFGSVRQTVTLARRYVEIFFADRLNLLVLLAQAPVIALMTFLVTGENQPRDFVYFILSLVSIWFGISIAAREIVRERRVFKRERMINLGLVPFLASKFIVLGLIVGLQCVLLFLPLKFFDLAGLMPMPGVLFGVPQLWTMLLTAAVGIALGLFISAVVKTGETATSLVPLVLIPQILFSGIIGVPSGANKAIGFLMPTTWSFDSVKRFSDLDTLEPEGAKTDGKTGGLGLYKFVETENDKIFGDAKKELKEYKKNAQEKLEVFENDLRNGGNPFPPQLGEIPTLANPLKPPVNLSNYVAFLHPSMNAVLNQIVLMLMFCILVVAVLIALRLRDTG